SGTNAVHGTAYAYGRNSAWDARNFFETPGTPKVPVELEQFGGSLGGAIRKDQLFYFLNFEQQRYSVGNAVQHKVPITAPGVGSATQNLIATCNAVRATGPVAGLSAQLAGLSTDCVPLANFPGLLPGFPKRRSHTKPCELHLQRQYVSHVHGSNERGVLRATGIRISGRFLIPVRIGLAQDCGTRRRLPSYRHGLPPSRKPCHQIRGRNSCESEHQQRYVKHEGSRPIPELAKLLQRQYESGADRRRRFLAALAKRRLRTFRSGRLASHSEAYGKPGIALRDQYRGDGS